MVDDDGQARSSFLDVHVPAHLAFYRAGIAAITDEDAYAGLLVSMHGAGIYQQRYGADPGLNLTRAPEAQELVDAFVVEQEGSFSERMAEAGVDDELRLADYHRLQWADRFSLAFCLREWDEPGEPFELGEFRFEPVAPVAGAGLAVAVHHAGARLLARPPARAEARLEPVRVPGGVLRAAGRAPRRSGSWSSLVAVGERLTWLRVPDRRGGARRRSTSSGSRRSRSSASSRTCFASTRCGPTTCSPGTPGTRWR